MPVRTLTFGITLYGISLTVEQWSLISGVPSHVIAVRKQRGWSDKRSVFQPYHPHTVGDNERCIDRRGTLGFGRPSPIESHDRRYHGSWID